MSGRFTTWIITEFMESKLGSSAWIKLEDESGLAKGGYVALDAHAESLLRQKLHITREMSAQDIMNLPVSARKIQSIRKPTVLSAVAAFLDLSPNYLFNLVTGGARPPIPEKEVT